ncbi:MAG: DUF5916 domain-containing protein [Bacteroidetes bacterium]|nr:DUF5916 domain-containing protein [Bacteroidota bacterium]
MLRLIKWPALLRAAVVVCILFQFTPAEPWAQSVETDSPFLPTRLTESIDIDGFVNDPAWEEVAPLPLVMYEPVFRGDLSERTDIRIAYDDQYLYLGANLYDSNPAGIRANSMYRDLYSGDDTVSLILDTFNDRQNGLWFFTNPNGIRADMAISNDLEGIGGSPFGTVINSSWNTFWDVATQVTDMGWSVEMRIPFTSLGFQAEQGVVEMGFSVSRQITRKNETYIYPAIPPNWNLAYAKPSQLGRIQLRDVHAGRPVYITPYVSGGGSTEANLVEDESRYEHQSRWTGDIGGDVKYNLTNNLTLDLTVNTDFAQAEADDEQVNLTRFSLFFPEKRRFFQERAGIFDFRTSGRFDRLFNTRQIGLYEGETVPIYGGLRLVGRVGNWDVGAINMQTAAAHGNPSENFGIYRLRKQIFNPNSYVGSMVTTRIASNGYWNIVYGLDSQIKVGNREYLEFKWAQVFDEAFPDISLRNNSFARARIERRTEIGLSYILSSTWGGPNFEPGMGFVSRTGFIQPLIVFGYGWFASEASRVLSMRPRVVLTQFRRDSDRSIESGAYWFSWFLSMKSGAYHTFELQARTEDILEAIEFPEDTEVPIGKYNFYNLGWEYMAQNGRLLRVDGAASVGSFYDGTNVEIQAEPTWNLSRHLELGATYQFNRVRFPDRGQAFFVHIARIRTQIGFSTQASINAFLQYNTASDVVSANIRFRYNFREGNDLWIVYNEGRNTDRLSNDPELPFLDGRRVLMKYTYTFIR